MAHHTKVKVLAVYSPFCRFLREIQFLACWQIQFLTVVKPRSPFSWWLSANSLSQLVKATEFLGSWLPLLYLQSQQQLSESAGKVLRTFGPMQLDWTHLHNPVKSCISASLPLITCLKPFCHCFTDYMLCSKNSYIEILTSNKMILGGAASERYLDHEPDYCSYKRGPRKHSFIPQSCTDNKGKTTFYKPE